MKQRRTEDKCLKVLERKKWEVEKELVEEEDQEPDAERTGQRERRACGGGENMHHDMKVLYKVKAISHTIWAFELLSSDEKLKAAAANGLC